MKAGCSGIVKGFGFGGFMDEKEMEATFFTL